MKIAVSGATGFIGSHVTAALQLKGHTVLPLQRQYFGLSTEDLASLIAGCDLVINLAGAPINRRWTTAYKKTILSSRISTTRRLVKAMSQLDTPPKTFISTSAIGAFDDKGCYTESDKPNATDFLGEVSQQWEAEARKAEVLGVRTLIFRFAIVLGHDGGLMKQVLLPFRIGLGGPIGDGSQHFSWVHIDDLVMAYLYALEDPDASGIYHICSPNTVTNLKFSRTLGQVLKRPARLPVPALLLKAAFGEGAEVMTSGQCVISERLPNSCFAFRFPDLRGALQQIVEKKIDPDATAALPNAPAQPHRRQ